MKFIIVFAALFAVAFAMPGDVETVLSNSDVQPEGFQFAYETSDGTKHESAGHIENAGKENEGIAVRGSYEYVAPDGQHISVNYVADENGFQPEGAHLPVAPIV